MLLRTEPFTFINDLTYWHEDLRKILDSTTVNSICYDNLPNDINSRYQFVDIQKGLLYVCTETVFKYPHTYISEKSFKGITAKRPFVIVGAPHTLHYLKNQGFKTFDQWWDEDYDFELDPTRRIEKIYSIIKFVCSKSLPELQDLCLEMADILEHNFNHYSEFGKNELNQFNQSCLDNLTNKSHV